MNPDLTRSETLIEDGHTYGETEAMADLARVHAVYCDTLAAFTASAIKNRIMLTEHDIGVAMEGVGEVLAHEADRPLEVLTNESYTPANATRLITVAHETIVDALRVKPIDWSGTFEKMFRPQPTRGSAPTNPATLIAKGDDL